MRCLIVDDDVICRKAVVEWLKEVAVCDEAVDGREAIAKFTDAIRDEQPYDVIILDLIMPGLDGHETAREIRKIGKRLTTGPETRIIILTILNSVNDAMKAFYLGHCLAYMVKPVSEQTLISTFRQIGLF